VAFPERLVCCAGVCVKFTSVHLPPVSLSGRDLRGVYSEVPLTECSSWAAGGRSLPWSRCRHLPIANRVRTLERCCRRAFYRSGSQVSLKCRFFLLLNLLVWWRGPEYFCDWILIIYVWRD